MANSLPIGNGLRIRPTRPAGTRFTSLASPPTVTRLWAAGRFRTEAAARRAGVVTDRNCITLTTDDNRLMAVTVRTAAGSLQAEPPHELFAMSTPSDKGDNASPYDVTADGQRLLVEDTAGAQVSVPLTAVVSWQAGLKK